ncbi:MAG: pyruvate dehydrogenase complex E1 component subunit beta [Actinobacteria bacterium]|nr:MAG: pyruvate dehydrogenase complex E1 component subunit beta [Actinomycetota bacterium]
MAPWTSPTPPPSPSPPPSTTTSTCSATRWAAGTRSTPVPPPRTGGRTSGRCPGTSSRAAPATSPSTRPPPPVRSAPSRACPTRPTPRRATPRRPTRKGPTPTAPAPTAPAPTAPSEKASSVASVRYREALNQALREEMHRDEAVMLMGEDIGVFNGAFKVTQGLLEEFGERRVRDTPISENTIVGMGVGAAMTGLRPVVELMTVNFSLLALDQIVNHAAHIRYMFGGQVKVPLVVRMPQGAGHQLGPTHSHCFEAIYLHVPGLLVAAPSTAADAKGLLKAAIRDDNPVIFIEHEYLYGRRGEVPEDDDHVQRFGEAAIRREGSDVTIVGVSRMALTAEQAAETLADEHDLAAEVLDPRTLRPLDLDTILQSVHKTNRCVIVEEGWPHGGVGANLAALVQEQAFDYLDAPVARVTGADVPMPYSKPLEEIAYPHAPQIVQAALATLRDV